MGDELPRDIPSCCTSPIPRPPSLLDSRRGRPERGQRMSTPENDEQMMIDRREAIRRVSALLGGVAIVGGNALWTGCRAPRSAGAEPFVPFAPDEVAFLDEVADTMLPDTARSPGAKAARVGAFMALMVADCYDEDDQRVFRRGMRRLD